MPLFKLLLAMLLWGSAFPLAKQALQVYDPFWIVFVRMVIASGIFLIFRKRFGKIEYRTGDWKWLLITALFEPCCYFLFETHALQLTSSSEAAMITALAPVTVTFGAWCFFHERISFRKGLGLGVAVTGVMVLTAYGESTSNAPHPVLGNFLEIMAVFCGTGYSLSVKALSKRYSAFFLTAVQVFIGAVFFLPLLFCPFAKAPTVLHWNELLAVLYLGFFCSGLPYFLYSASLSKLPAYQVSIFVNLIPVFGIFFGWILLGETLTGIQYAAVVIIFTGILLGSDISKKDKPTHKPTLKKRVVHRML